MICICALYINASANVNYVEGYAPNLSLNVQVESAKKYDYMQRVKDSYIPKYEYTKRVRDRYIHRKGGGYWRYRNENISGGGYWKYKNQSMVGNENTDTNKLNFFKLYDNNNNSGDNISPGTTLIGSVNDKLNRNYSIGTNELGNDFYTDGKNIQKLGINIGNDNLNLSGSRSNQKGSAVASVSVSGNNSNCLKGTKNSNTKRNGNFINTEEKLTFPNGGFYWDDTCNAPTTSGESVSN